MTQDEQKALEERALQTAGEVYEGEQGHVHWRALREACEAYHAALAEAQQGKDVNSLIDEIRWVVGQLKTHRHSIEMKFERLKTGANVHAVNNAKHSLMAYLYRIQKKFEVLEGQD